MLRLAAASAKVASVRSRLAEETGGGGWCTHCVGTDRNARDLAHAPSLRVCASSRRPLPLGLVVLTHVDDDHVAGLLELFTAIAEARDERRPAPATIAELWHNSFDEVGWLRACPKGHPVIRTRDRDALGVRIDLGDEPAL